ncbi:phage portal protein [Zongyangia hominis]|uniref:Phage portal protein n=1 Tax=Zongyangia hominis TaxID=2763677 RepID=A0A926IBU4_9FIRM|nr:phage portal protein [Zongyangia hominis]MBC8570542.1 phage portal protein [Zongyangia hominis]
MRFSFGRRGRPAAAANVVQTSPPPGFDWDKGMLGLDEQCRLYDRLRESVPLIDAALCKIVRLTMGDITVSLGDKKAERELAAFLERVPVSGGGAGLGEFLARYLDSLLCYGNAVGEVVLDHKRGEIAGLYHASLADVEARPGENPLETRIFSRSGGFDLRPVPYPQLVLFSALSPRPGEAVGRSLLRSLPFVSDVLLKIFEATRQNFERVGNVRFAVTYHPGDGPMDRAYAQEMARHIADEWRSAISAQDGRVRDFVCVGDVDIKVIGADNQVLDIQVPVRQMTEQIVAKLGVPPFLLGLQWSTTERMSAQQADILTSELDCYRTQLNAVIRRIVGIWLGLRGIEDEPVITWESINLQDEVELAKARLYDAQARQLEQILERGEVKP